MEQIERIKLYLEIGTSALITLSALILIIKLLFKKLDKNKNGKIEKEEITDADMQFCKELIKESFKTIATGIFKETGINAKKGYELMLSEIKKSKSIIEETIKNNEIKGE